MGFRSVELKAAACAAALVLAATAGWSATAQDTVPAKAQSATPPQLEGPMSAAKADIVAKPSSAPATAAAGTTAGASTAALKPGDAAAGQARAAVCGACHGMDGNSSDPQYPKLAGQQASYITQQLNLFKSGKRQNAIMMGMAAGLSEQDMRNLGAYYASKKVVPGVADEALVELGQKVFRQGDLARGVPACMACHGMDGRGNPGAIYAQLAGQHAQYVEATLKAWHDGTTWGTDAHAQIMPAIAKRLDPQEIAAVASYVEGLHGTGSAQPTHPPSP